MNRAIIMLVVLAVGISSCTKEQQIKPKLTVSKEAKVHVSSEAAFSRLDFSAKHVVGHKGKFTAVASLKRGEVMYNHIWDFGDGEESHEASPVHEYADVSKSYTVTLTVDVKDADGYMGTFTKTKSISIAVIPEPSDFVFSGAKDSVTMFFRPTSFPNPNYTYTWSFGDGSTQQGYYSNHTYGITKTLAAIPGCISTDYVVSLTVTSETGNSKTISKSLSMCYSDPYPISIFYVYVDAKNPSIQPVHFLRTLTEGSRGDYYSWDFGDGSFSSLMEPLHVFTFSHVVVPYTYTYIPAVTVTSRTGKVSQWLMFM